MSCEEFAWFCELVVSGVVDRSQVPLRTFRPHVSHRKISGLVFDIFSPRVTDDGFELKPHSSRLRWIYLIGEKIDTPLPFARA